MRIVTDEPNKPKYKGYWQKKNGVVQRYLVISGYGKPKGRLPKRRGIGVTRRPGSRRLPASTLVQRINNPQRGL